MPTATKEAPAPAKAAAKVAKQTAKPDIKFPALEKDAVVSLKVLIRADAKRTDSLRAFAGKVIEIRKAYNDPAGTTQAYREAVARVYASVAIPPDSASQLQASIRYHIGNELRTAYSPEELQAVGLSEKTPLERARESRDQGTRPRLPAGPPAADSPATGAVKSLTAHRADEAEAFEKIGAPSQTAQALISIGAGTLAEGIREGRLEVLQPINPPVSGRKKEKRDYHGHPRPAVVAPPDPLVLLGHALDSVRSAARLPVSTTEVPSLRDIIRRARAELDQLEKRIDAGDKTAARTAAAKAAS